MGNPRQPGAYSPEEQDSAFSAWLEARIRQAQDAVHNPPQGLAEAIRTAREALKPFHAAFPWPTAEWQQMDAARRGLDLLAKALEQEKTETPR